jgi:hypothetical protein
MSFVSILLQASATFNLICTGTIQGGENGQPPSVTRSFTDVVSVNLADRSFCFVPCMQARPIASVTPTEIVFQDGPDTGATHFRKYDRQSGAYVAKHDLPLVYSRSDGHCREAPFTGFDPPARWSPPTPAQ